LKLVTYSEFELMAGTGNAVEGSVVENGVVGYGVPLCGVKIQNSLAPSAERVGERGITTQRSSNYPMIIPRKRLISGM
jgi:hypothetical protein